MCTKLLIMYKPFRLAHSPHNNPVVRQTPHTQSDCDRPCRHDPKRAYIVILTSLPPESFGTVEMPSIHFPNAYVRSCYLKRFLSLFKNNASVTYRCASQMSIKKLFFPKKFILLKGRVKNFHSPRRSLCYNPLLTLTESLYSANIPFYANKRKKSHDFD